MFKHIISLSYFVHLVRRCFFHRCCFAFGSIVVPFSHQFPCMLLRTLFLCFSFLFRKGSPLGSLSLPLASFWHPLASIWLPFGSLWHPFGSLSLPFDILFVSLPYSIWLLTRKRYKDTSVHVNGTKVASRMDGPGSC